MEVELAIGLITVRMNEPDDVATDEAYAVEQQRHGMADFYELVHALVPAPPK